MRVRSVLVILITLALIAIVNLFVNKIIQPPFELSRISSKGEQILVGSEAAGCSDWSLFDAAKKKGAASMDAKDFKGAITYYQEALKRCSNAPETLIYLNNARISEELNSEKLSSDKVYALAVSVPITGSDPGKALMMLRGFSQAQTEALYGPETLYSIKFNSSGNSKTVVDIENIYNKKITGTPIQLKVIDDSDKPEIAAQIAGELLKDNSILAIAGHWSSATSLKAANEYKSKRAKVFISPISISDELNDKSGYIFRINTVSEVGSEVLVKYITKTLNKTKVAIFYDETNKLYCVELKDKIIDKIGKENLIDSYNLSDPKLEIRSALERIKTSSADTVLVLIPAAWSTNKALQVVAENARSDHNFSLIGDMSNLYTLTTLQVGNENAKGMVLAPAWNYDRYKTSEFAKNSSALWGEVNFAAALSYDAAEALIQALKKSPSSSGIHEELFDKDLKVEGSSGQFSFNPLGDAGTKAELVKVCTPREALPPPGTTVDFLPIIGQVDPCSL